MRIIIALGHPAHFHLFKNIIYRLTTNGNVIKVVISEKDILIKLLEEHSIEYNIFAFRKKSETLYSKGLKIIRSTLSLNKIVKNFKPDLMIGSLTQPAYISLLTGIPYIFAGEDDITYTFLQGLVTYPFVSSILAPEPTKVGIFKFKKTSYNGYQKLSYLHPNVFHPNISLLNTINTNKPFYLIRLVNLNAYHDIGATGFDENVIDTLIKKLEEHGNVYITSENQLNNKYKKYILPVNIKDIHHLMYFADIYIGDSQSMAVEAAVLGTPSVRFNNFAGKISVLSQLEHQYELTYSIRTNDPERLFQTIDKLLSTNELKNKFQQRRQKMLDDKIDVTSFMVWFIENYPKSKRIMKENPNYQYKFK
jgi:uncharacterized protein